MLKVLGVSLQNLGTELETNLGLCSHTSLGIHWDHLWLFVLGLQINVQNIVLTFGFLVAANLALMFSLDLVIIIFGLWSFYLFLYH